MNYNRLTSIMAIVLLTVFCIFVFFYERYEYNEALSRIKQHGIVISNALWNLDPQGSKEYLILACKSHNYKTLNVIDNKGRLFQGIEGESSGFIENFFISVHLISEENLVSDIIYKNKKVGIVEVTWKRDTIYLELYVLLALLLVYSVFNLNIRLLRSRNLLEQRVKDRTMELSIVNNSLQFEVQEHLNARDALYKSEEKYRILIENIPDILYRTDMEGNIIFISRSCENLSGYRVDEVVNKNVREIFYADSKDRDKFLVALEKNGYVNNYEEKLKRKDGSVWWASTNAHFFKDPNGNVAGVEGIFRDVTSRKSLENELRQAQKMESIGTLTGGIAHDFNNILGIMIGNAELAMDYIPKWNSAHAKIEAIKKAGLRASGIVKQLLSFSRKTDMILKPIDLVSVIKESVELLRATIPTSIEIRTNISDIEATILGNRTQINQIIINLCINASHAMAGMEGVIDIGVEKYFLSDASVLYPSAYSAATDFPDSYLQSNGYGAYSVIDYSGQKQSLPLTAAGSDDYVKITVTDTGDGIDPDIIDKIFDPYFTTKSVDKGTGMGLAVVHGIVKNHNGVITVQSSPSNGTTFTIIFPLVPKVSETAFEVGDTLLTGSESILFVDDDQFIADMTKEMLEQLGYRVESSTDAQSAFELFLLKPHDFDLVITDMTMPRMTGAKLAEKVREIRSDIPVIICSGYSSLIDAEKAYETGISAYMMKPISMHEMGKTIRSVLDKSTQ